MYPNSAALGRMTVALFVQTRYGWKAKEADDVAAAVVTAGAPIPIDYVGFVLDIEEAMLRYEAAS